MSPALHRARGAQTVPPYIQCGEMPSRNKVIAGILFSLYFRTQGCNLALLVGDLKVRFGSNSAFPRHRRHVSYTPVNCRDVAA